MEQRLRLVGGSRYEKRNEDRHPIAVSGQILWKDAKGNTRMASVVTRDVSVHGVSVDCQGGTPIPLYRLVYFQVDRSQRERTDLPAPLRKSTVLSAVFRVGPVSNDTVTIGFRQHIAANQALRTGAYSKTLTFTLSTTTP